VVHFLNHPIALNSATAAPANSSTSSTHDRAWFAGIGVLGIIVGILSLGMIWTTRDVSQMQAAVAESQNREVERLRDRLATVEAEFSELKAYRAGGFEICKEPQQ